MPTPATTHYRYLNENAKRKTLTEEAFAILLEVSINSGYLRVPSGLWVLKILLEWEIFPQTFHTLTLFLVAGLQTKL